MASSPYTVPVRLTSHERVLLGLYRGLSPLRRHLIDVAVWLTWTRYGDQGSPAQVRHRDAHLVKLTGTLDAGAITTFARATKGGA
jgi:hypothetical protein